MITLSGLGLNYKTSVCLELQEEYEQLTFSEPYYEVYKEIVDSLVYPLGLYFDVILAEFIRLKVEQPMITARGPEDQYCFMRLMADGVIPNTKTLLWTKVQDELGCGHIDLMNSLGRDRYFLKSMNKEVIEQLISELPDDSPRKFIYKSADEFLRIQDLFYEIYKAEFPNHTLIELKGTPREDIDMLKSLIADNLF